MNEQRNQSIIYKTHCFLCGENTIYVRFNKEKLVQEWKKKKRTCCLMLKLFFFNKCSVQCTFNNRITVNLREKHDIAMETVVILF